MLEDIDVANINLRRMEKELLAARQTLWDQFFIACLPACVVQWGGAGVPLAVEIADEALRAREAKVLA